MKTKSLFLLVTACCSFSSLIPFASAQGTAFTYQGRLDAAGSPANGIYDLEFRLFDAASEGTQQSGTWTQPALGVTNGLFTVELDFGSFFPGASRWLQIGVRTNGGSSFTTLTPRQKFAATPYAITAGNFSGSITAAQLPAGVVTNSASGVNLTGNFSGNGANVTNVNAATLGGLSSAGFWKTNGNTGANPANGAFLGTTDNQPLEIRVNNVRGLRIEPDPRPGISSANIIGGSPSNRIEFPGSGGSAIVGGGLPDSGNVIRSNSSGVFIGAGSRNEVGPNADDVVIAGGYGNNVRSPLGAIGGGAFNQVQTNTVYATIGGGYENSVQSGSEFSTISGGANNSVQSNAWRGTVGGGVANTVGAPEGTIAGGAFNSALAFSATIGGGGGNAASGEWSTIAGGRDNLLTNANYATIGGGYANSVQSNSSFSTIGGGLQNQIQSNAFAATIPGGSQNTAADSFAFAAGRRAKANHSGTFVWADATDADFTSTGANQFLIRAGGGVGINTANPTATLHVAGNARVEGLIQLGSGTNTAQPPDKALLIRRVVSNSPTVGHVVARTDKLTLERDGNYAGWRIVNQANPGNTTIAATGLSATGTVNSVLFISGGAAAGTNVVFTDAQNVVSFRCSFGDSYNIIHQTEVSLARYTGDYFWTGTMTSTFDQ